MSDFFYREVDKDVRDAVQKKGTGRIRNNAWVRVQQGSNGNVLLPVATSGFTSTYDPTGTNRAAPTLGNVSIKLEGEAGSLRRAEVEYRCYDKPSFEDLEDKLLKPKSEVTISYGYAGPDSPSKGGSHVFRVYDYSFKITKEGYFDCKFKAVGKGGTYTEVDISTAVQNLPTGKVFVANYDGINEKAAVQSIMDYIDYDIQTILKELDDYVFDPPDGSGGELTGKRGHFGTCVAPSSYEPPAGSGLNVGYTVSDQLIYITLEAFVKIINRFVLLPFNKQKKRMIIAFHRKYSRLSYEFEGIKVFSADPISMLFPYKSGAEENLYTDVEGLGRSTNRKKGKRMSSIKASGRPPESKTDRHSRLDAGLWEVKGIPTIDGNDGSPKGILLSRDFLRQIYNSFTDDTLDTTKDKDDTEPASIKIEPLFKKIFARIKEASGGAWDLYLEQDEDGIKKDPEFIYIVNKKAPIDVSTVTPLQLDPIGGVNGIRELEIQAKVPKAVVAKAFIGTEKTSNETEHTMSAINQDTESDPKKKLPKTAAELSFEARRGLVMSGYDSDAVNTAKGNLKTIIENLNREDAVKAGQIADEVDLSKMPFPLEFTCTLDGVEGFKFGDTLSSSYLPKRYTTENNGTKVVFTVTSFEHKFQNNDWTTVVSAIARIRR